MKNITVQDIRAALYHTNYKRISTHQKLCIPIITRIYKKMELGIQFEPIKIYDAEIIIDGHHRYVAAILAKEKLEEVPYPITSSTKKCPWDEVEFVFEDWDTPAKIEELNERDAQYNNMTISELLQLLK